MMKSVVTHSPSPGIMMFIIKLVLILFACKFFMLFYEYYVLCRFTLPDKANELKRKQNKACVWDTG